MNSRLQMRNPPTRISLQLPKGDFAAVARGFNRCAMESIVKVEDPAQQLKLRTTGWRWTKLPFGNSESA